MNKVQQNQYRMAGLTATFLTDHAARLSPSPMAVAEAADVQTAYAALQASLGQGVISTKENTATAETAQATALRLLPALLGPLRSHARKTHNAELLARATISAKQLDKLRPAPLRDVLLHLLNDATTYKTALATYGFSSAVKDLLGTAISTFAATVGTTKGLLNANTGTHASSDDLLLAFLQQCYELDDAMEIFGVLDADLLRDYAQARRVGKSGGGKGKAGGAAKPAPGA